MSTQPLTTVYTDSLRTCVKISTLDKYDGDKLVARELLRIKDIDDDDATYSVFSPASMGQPIDIMGDVVFMLTKSQVDNVDFIIRARAGKVHTLLLVEYCTNVTDIGLNGEDVLDVISVLDCAFTDLSVVQKYERPEESEKWDFVFDERGAEDAYDLAMYMGTNM